MKDLEKENSRLKRLLADAELDSTLMAAVIRRPQGGLREGCTNGEKLLTKRRFWGSFEVTA